MTSLSEAEGGWGHGPLDPGLIDLFSCIAASLFNKLTYLLTYLLFDKLILRRYHRGVQLGSSTMP